MEENIWHDVSVNPGTGTIRLWVDEGEDLAVPAFCYNGKFYWSSTLIRDSSMSCLELCVGASELTGVKRWMRMEYPETKEPKQ